MKVGIIVWDDNEFESQTLIKTAEALGWTAVPFTLQDVVISIASSGSKLVARGVDLATLDGIIVRANVRQKCFKEDLDRYALVESLGIPLSDPFSAFLIAESKLRTMTALLAAGLPIPETRVCNTLEDIEAAACEFGCTVIKPSYGYGGRDVERITEASIVEKQPLILDLLKRHGVLLAQRFIPHPDGDYRVTVVGGEVAFAIRRVPNERSWKANISLGADFQMCSSIDPVAADIAIRAARTVGLGAAGVDLLRDGNGYVVLEVNNCPGWTDLTPEGIFAVCQRILETVTQGRAYA